MFDLEKSSQRTLPPDYHHPMGASQLKRISFCSGSVDACAGIKQESGEAAKFGSLVHQAAYDIYCLDMGTFDRYTPEIIEKASAYIRALKLLTGLGLDAGLMEYRLFMPGLFYKGEQLTGTVDYAAVIPFERLLIVDLKTGMQDVQPKDNLQLMFYAAACFYNLDEFSRASIPKIDLVIIQINDKVGVEVKTHTVTELEIASFAADLINLIREVEDFPTLTPGEHCHELYCPARFTCPAYKKYVADNVGGEIIEIPAQELPQVVDLARWLNIIPAVEDKIDQIKKLALQAALDNPDAVPGWTVKQSFGHRKWENDEEAKKALYEVLEDDAYEPAKLITPAAAEKVLKAEQLKKEYLPATVRPDLGYRLVKKTKDEIDHFLEGTDD